MDQLSLPTNYRIFLLTVWRDDNAAANKAVLRFSVHDPRSGQRRGFSEMESLLAFLEARLDARDVVNFGDTSE